MSLVFSGLLQEHKKLGLLLHPFLIKDLGKDYFRIHDRLSFANLHHHESHLSDIEKQIVKSVEEYSEQKITKRFTNKKITPRDFIKTLDQDYVKKFIRPFIEKKMAAVISLMMQENQPVFYRESQAAVYKSDQLIIEKEPAEVVFNFKKLPDETHYWQTISLNQEVITLKDKQGRILTNEPCWLQLENRLFHFRQNVDGKKLRIFFNKDFILVPKKLEEKFYKTFVKDCIRDFPFTHQGFDVEHLKPECKPALAFGHDFQGLPGLFLTFQYGKQKVNPADGATVLVNRNFTGTNWSFEKYYRDRDCEKGFENLLHEMGLKKTFENKYLVASQDERKENEKYNLISWLNSHARKLRKKGFIITHEDAEFRYYTGHIEMSLDVEDKNDWFDVYAMAKFGDDFEIPIIRLRKYLLNGIREYKLPDGRIAILPEHWFEKYSDLLSFGEKKSKSVRVRPEHFQLINESLKGSIKLTRKSFEASAKNSKNTNIQQPEKLHATLREYQTEGYRWLMFLNKHSLGGCLADDMGLGKTLQTLTMLLKHAEEQGYHAGPANNEDHRGQLDLFAQHENSQKHIRPSLVIMPASLIHNWENEIRKFTPSLTYLNYTGSQRFELQKNIKDVHLVLTTYGTIRNDFKDFEDLVFDYIILDESQLIKNPTSKTSRAIFRLNGKHRITLSGTPIENTLIDLWSQMNFLNPGLLGELPFFKKYFVTPIEKNNKEDKREKLNLLIKPFILRRTKTQVEKELPVLSEEYIYCEMSPTQKQIYLEEKSSIRNYILERIEKEGTDKAAFIMLQALTKLRQMANHPAMIQPGYNNDSGKFAEVIRNLETLISEGHKVLVFSSFVKHLRLFADYFQKNGIGYSMLTGDTRKRKEVISVFQNDPGRNIFLISIKAGGVGLNLTEAGYVFLLDPWWNPAVENQAINRAHRIGQTKHVFAYRFITLDTIEEKILRLQQKKSRLAELFIRTDNPLKELNVNDIKELID